MRHLLIVLCLAPLAACASQSEEMLSFSDRQRASFRLADSLEQRANYDAAIDIYRQMLAEGDAPMETYTRMADGFRKLGRAEEAAIALHAAALQNPSDTKITSKLAYALIDAGKYKEAVGFFDQLNAMEPQQHMHLSGKGIAFDYAGNHAAAQEIYEMALALAPDSPAVRNNLALSLMLCRRYDDAISILKPLAAGDHANLTIRQNLALAYSLKGDKAHALLYGSKLTQEQAEERLQSLGQRN